MVAGLALPPITTAIVTRLRDDDDLVALCSQGSGAVPRISTSLPESPDVSMRWVMPHYAILVRRAGGPGADIEIGNRIARLDFFCYGPGATGSIRQRTADQLWRTLDPVLCPPAGLRLPASFHSSGVEVVGIVGESDPIPSLEPGTDWWRVVASYLIEYSSTAVAA